MTDATARPSAGTKLASALVWALLAVLTVFFTGLIAASVALLGWADRRRRLAHRLAAAWGRSIFLLNPAWKLDIEGRERLDPAETYIFVANHQSLLDIPAGMAIGGQFKWVAKAELFDIPFLGWAMSLAKYVKLARGERASIRATYEETKRWLERGISVFFFPEGTRSHTGELGPFKNGAFKLAIDTGRPIVPVALLGTRKLLARGSRRVGFGSRVRVVILPPLDPSAYGKDFGRLRDEVRAIMHRAVHGA